MNSDDFNKIFGNHPYIMALSILEAVKKEVAKSGSLEMMMEMKYIASPKTNPHTLIIGGYLTAMFEVIGGFNQKEIDDKVREILLYIGLPTREEIIEDLSAFEKTLL